MLDRRQESAERRREHIAGLNKRAVETDLRLKRLYDAIEAGIADLDDPVLKERVANLKAIRDQAQADANRTAAIWSRQGRRSRRRWSEGSPERHANASRSTAAAIAATTFAHATRRGR